MADRTDFADRKQYCCYTENKEFANRAKKHSIF